MLCVFLPHNTSEKMTVKNRRDAECATASGDDTDVETVLETGPVLSHDNEENLLGRVLAGMCINTFWQIQIS